MSELLDLYEDYLITEKKASANTVSSYLRDMHQFEAAMQEQELELTEVLTQEVEHYAAALTRKGRSAATVTRSIASIKSFYSCLVTLGIMDHNPAKGVVPAKVERKLPQILTGKEVELLLEQPECTDLKGYRDRAMLELLYATGIRVSEVKYLTVEAAQAGRAEISLKGKIRTILIPAKLCRKLLKYSKKQKFVSGEIFLTRNEKGISRRQIWAEMKALCDKAGVAPSKVFPHNLRHLFAKCFYEQEKDLAHLADLLGHSSIETTRIYVAVSARAHEQILEKMRLIV